MVTHWRSGHRFLAASLLALGGLGATAVYDSEEHKMIADRGAGLVNQGSAQLPAGTRFETSTPTEALSMYRSAKLLAVGISSNSPGEYSDQTKKVQDNSYYWPTWVQVNHNTKLYIPEGEATLRTLIVPAQLGSARGFTFGELVSLYGDYRKTVHCVDGVCHLTNRDNTEYLGQGPPFPAPAAGPRQSNTTYFEWGYNTFGLSTGWRPDPVTTHTYLRSIASGVWPPYGGFGNTISNTAWESEELDAGWWGDEMLRIANINDWHFSSAAVAWYVGMHRMALSYVDRARTDSKYWNHALHYEAHALHSLTDLFAFGHVVTNRDRTSAMMIGTEGLTGNAAYGWLQNGLTMGGGVRTNGILRLTATLPVLQEVTMARADFMPSYRGSVDNANLANNERVYHDQFNAAGATVMNLKRQEFFIFGDAKMKDMTPAAKDVIIETVRASVQSLFDAYESGRTVDETGRVGSKYFDALLNIPAFVKSNSGHYFDGMWTRFAAAMDSITHAGVVPRDPGSCVILYLDGAVNLPAARTSACYVPMAPSQADIVTELVSGNGALGRGDQARLDADGNENGGYDVGDFLAWVRANNATPSSRKGDRP